tara:strand:- start:349 stop:588 length:240 start_codon:yes stop_codon:yes gene_type:complete
MNKYRIRYNKQKGKLNKGTIDHAWRVFEGNKKEYIFKNVEINGLVKTEKDENNMDYNIYCYGHMKINRETSTAIITGKK